MAFTLSVYTASIAGMVPNAADTATALFLDEPVLNDDQANEDG